MRELFVPAKIEELEILDPGELCRVCVSLPPILVLEGVSYTLVDDMRPGTAFLVKPWGMRTQKYRRRMYTRSNVAQVQPGILETFINYTHKDVSDTSTWWLSQDALTWYREGKPIDVRLQLDQENRVAAPYENTRQCKESNLRLEEDGQWEHKHMVCIAFGTGITPFLAYVRYLGANRFRPMREKGGGSLTLIASARHPRQLMCYQELFEMGKEYPDHFLYHPVLTRSWPDDWTGGKGRIMTAHTDSSGQEQVDMSKVFGLVKNFSQVHLRLCGNRAACREFLTGLDQCGTVPENVRSESW